MTNSCLPSGKFFGNLSVAFASRKSNETYAFFTGNNTVFAGFFCFGATQSTRIQEWPWYGGDAKGIHYSPLTEINRANVGALKPAWECGKTRRTTDSGKMVSLGPFETTPLMIDGVLFI